MAIHHLDVSIISRGKGHSVIAAAAYRAGVRLIDERTGEVHDYTRRSGVDGAPILAPAGAEPWTQDRSTLWNAAEKAEIRRDAQLARSWVLALPRELDPATNKRLGREVFDRHLVSRGMVVDLYFHELDGENPHAHALSAMRALAGAGFAPRKNRDWDDKQLVAECREGSATVINRYLAEAGIGRDEWVSHRTLRAQLTAALAECDYEQALKLCRLPTRHLGKQATAILARGETSTRAQDLKREAEANAARVAGLRLEVEVHPEQVAQLREEVGELNGRLDHAWRTVAENTEGERRTRRAAVESTPEGKELLRRKLRELDPEWQNRNAARVRDVDAALTYAENELALIASQREVEEARKRAARIEAVGLQAGGWALFKRKLAELAPGRDMAEADVAIVDEALADAENELERIASARRAAAARRLAEAQRQREARVEAVESQAGGRELYEGKLDELDPGWRGREEPKAEFVDAALAHAQNELERIASARRAAAARRLAEAQRQREARVEAVESQAGGRELYEGKLDELDPGWRGREEPKAEFVDAALTHAENELERIASARRAAAARRLAEAQRQREARVEAVELQAGGRELYEGKLDELDPGWRGREEPKAEFVDAALTHAENELERIASARRAAAARRLAEAQRQREARVEAVELQAGGRELYEGKLDELDPGWRGREGPRAECVDAALAHAQNKLARVASVRRAAAARRLAEEARQRTVRLEEIRKTSEGWNLYSQKLAELAPEWRETREAPAAQVDTALTYAEEKLEEDAKRRAGRVDALFDVPGCDAALFLALGGQTPNWRQAATSRDVDRALDRAEQSPARWASAVEHELVLDAERTFPGASSLEWRETGDAFRGGDATDNRARAMLGLLSDRARVRAIVVREPNPAPRSLVGRLVTWLRKQVAKLLQTLHLVGRAADAVEAGVPKTRPQPLSRPEYCVPALADETLESPPGADAFAKAVYGEVRDRYDRRAVAEDRGAGSALRIGRRPSSGAWARWSTARMDG